jgi:anti-sigma-K factor RskA
MNEAEHRSVHESLGAYALGALSDTERERVAAHIETCPICAEDAASFERAAARLIDVVPAVDPPPELRHRIMSVVESEASLLRATAEPPEEVRIARTPRRSWLDGLSLRWATAAAAALVIGGVVGSQVFGGGDGSNTRTLSADVGRGHAWVEVTGQNAKLVVDGLVSPGANRVYELWVQHGTEMPRPASENLADATFVVGSGGVEIPAHLEDGDRVLVTSEPMGGSRTPTTAPVVVTSRV